MKWKSIKPIDLEKRLQNHTSRIETALREDQITPLLIQQHLQEIQFLQNERIAHLLVVLGTLLALLLSIIILLLSPSAASVALSVLFFVLIIPYLRHYFILENTIQRWYQLYEEIELLSN